MLDTLIESKTNARNRLNRAGFMTVTTVLMTGLFSSVLVWSIFAKELSVGNQSLEFSALIAPVPETDPPIPEQIQPRAIKQTTNSPVKETTRNAIISRTDEQQAAPDKISIAPNIGKSRPADGTSVVIKPGREDDGTISQGNDINERTNIENTAVLKTVPKKSVETEIEIPPPVKKTVEKVVEKVSIPPVKKIVSGGVLNGNAVNLPVPSYSAAARAVGASGEVSVQVLIDESGNVVSASATNGHPLLRAEAVKAALRARFTPTLLSKQPVKVSGVIIYKFAR